MSETSLETILQNGLEELSAKLAPLEDLAPKRETLAVEERRLAVLERIAAALESIAKGR